MFLGIEKQKAKNSHKEKLINPNFSIILVKYMSQVQVLNDVEKTTLRILQLYDNADIVGELDTHFNVIMINGLPVDRLIEFLEKTGFSRIDANMELEYAIIDINEYLAYYIVNEKWANYTVIVQFEYWVDVENDNIKTRLKEIVIRAKP